MARNEEVLRLFVHVYVSTHMFMLLAGKMRIAPATAMSGWIAGSITCVSGLINRVHLGKIGE